MKAQTFPKEQYHYTSENVNRNRLLEELPSVREKNLQLAGISTTILEGGDSPTVILLHGPGETALWWMRVIPKLTETNRVIIPDLPGHGETKADVKLNEERVLRWLSKLIDQTCSFPPTLVGHILGGSIAARFAISRGEQIDQLVLVDSLGLGKFRPAPRFAFGLFRFMMWPTEKNYNRFLPQCMFDADDLRSKMGENWDPFLTYILECARDTDRKSAMQTLMKTVGVPKIASAKLINIKTPTALIWGRHDRANKLKIAEAASKKFGWPLHIIEKTRDDPKLERPRAFLQALYKSMKTKRSNHVTKRKEKHNDGKEGNKTKA